MWISLARSLTACCIMRVHEPDDGRIVGRIEEILGLVGELRRERVEIVFGLLGDLVRRGDAAIVGEVDRVEDHRLTRQHDLDLRAIEE